MKILALDQASRVSGWAIFANNDLLTYGKIDLSKQDDIGERLHLLRQKVKQLIEEYQIDKVILEDIYMDGQRINNVQTFKTLAEVFGVLFELCVDLEIPVEAVKEESAVVAETVAEFSENIAEPGTAIIRSRALDELQQNKPRKKYKVISLA